MMQQILVKWALFENFKYSSNNSFTAAILKTTVGKMLIEMPLGLIEHHATSVVGKTFLEITVLKKQQMGTKRFWIHVHCIFSSSDVLTDFLNILE